MVMHPVGPLPASTYWRRRLVLLGVLVVVVLLLRSCVGGGGSGRPTAATPTATHGPSATRTPAPRPTATRLAGPLTCPDRTLQVSTRSDAAQYPVGTSPRFTITVRNTGSVACRRDLGPLEVVVRSGADRIWASTDCAPKAPTALMRLGAGGSLEATKTWDGKRSKPGCTGTRAAARPGTYTVRATIGTLTSTVTVFRVTGSA